MITIIRNAKVYQPEYAGIKDVMLIGSQIGALGENLKADLGGAVEVKEIDGTGLLLSPASLTATNTSWEEAGREAFTPAPRRPLSPASP